MKKIYDFIVSIPKDKLLHMLVEMLITMVTILVFKICGLGMDACAYGWAVGFAFGISKELYDEKKKGISESTDWLYDIVACTVVALYSLILMM